MNDPSPVSEIRPESPFDEEAHEATPDRWAMLPLQIGIVAVLIGLVVVILPIPAGGTDAHAFLLVAAFFEGLCAAIASVVICVRMRRAGVGLEPMTLSAAGLIAACLVLPLTATGLERIRHHAQRERDYGPGLEKLEAFYDALNQFATEHDGKFPDKLTTIVSTDDTSPFRSTWRRPGTEPTVRTVTATDIYRHGDFVFCYKGLGGTDAPPSSILAFSAKLAPGERNLELSGTGRHAPGTRLVLFGNGRAQAIADFQFQRLLNAENQRRIKKFGLRPIEPRQFEHEHDPNLAV